MACFYKDGKPAINGAYYPCRNGVVFNATSATAAFNATGLRMCFNPYSWTEVKLCEPGVYCCGPDKNAERARDCCSNMSARFLLPDLEAMSGSKLNGFTGSPSTASSTTQASSSTPSPSNTPQPSSPSAGIIAGPVIGGAVALALLVVAILLFRRSRHKRQQWTPPDQKSPPVEVDGRLRPGELAG
ncbi:hypothetical protein CDD80_4324 [Ophiocordyceps camponoti-rufipedis]|uniref:Mid2 domain-containing protein n=1 Tax=Ophiocordyceps camponoti-rufipedis TaxID=2004952 RepID=A0A2C5ZMJ0_9HYPO|nr:hypothetical protein CDD80_4324 [Ophiocordyceps camponoti-rufipedis]